MPFNQEQLAYAGRAAIDFYMKNDPIDQINTERPLFKKLVSEKQPYSGGLQYVVEQLREANDSNFQAYSGDAQVTYNRKRTLNQAKFSWGSFHDGFGLNEDELVQNGITVVDDRGATPSADEKVNLTNLIKENVETLKLGFQEGFDLMLHRDGTQDPEEIAGLDAIVSLDPENVDIGGIDAGAKAYWRNYANTNIAASGLVDAMEVAWRETIRYGGMAPNFILAGADFIDAYRTQASQTVNRQITLGGKGGNSGAATIDASVGSGTETGVFFKGAQLIWDPVFDVLDAADTPAEPWAKRCYFLNTKFLKLRPIKNHWMVPRKPPRVYDRYVQYWATTAKAALTTGKRNAHAVLTIY